MIVLKASRITPLEEETYSPEVYGNLESLLQKNARLEKRPEFDSLYARRESVMAELS